MVPRESKAESHLCRSVCRSYGWIAPHSEISGLEDEYHLAQSKPRLVYVKSVDAHRDERLEALLSQIRQEGLIVYASFTTIEELVAKVRQDIMQLLSESFLLTLEDPPPLKTAAPGLQSFRDDLAENHVLRRQALLDEVERQVSQSAVVQLVGDPGIGKTYILGSLTERPDSIYVPLRGRSTQQAFSYLASQLSLRRGRVPRRLITEEEAATALQVELENNSATLLVDEAEQNPAATAALASLDFYGNRLLVATRREIEAINVQSGSRMRTRVHGQRGSRPTLS